MPTKPGLIWINPLPANLVKFGLALDAGLTALMKYESNSVQNHARTNAPWTDRTGNARQGLFAEDFKGKTAGPLGPTYGIVLYHTMPYGIFLETRFSEKYAIIRPTIKKYGPEVMNAARQLIAKLG